MKKKTADRSVREFELEYNAGGCLLCFSSGSRSSCANQLAEFSPKHTHMHRNTHNQRQTHNEVNVSFLYRPVTEKTNILCPKG